MNLRPGTLNFEPPWSEYTSDQGCSKSSFSTPGGNKRGGNHFVEKKWGKNLPSLKRRENFWTVGKANRIFGIFLYPAQNGGKKIVHSSFWHIFRWGKNAWQHPKRPEEIERRKYVQVFSQHMVHSIPAPPQKNEPHSGN